MRRKKEDEHTNITNVTMQNMWQVPERSSDDFKATTRDPTACRS
jgi:hypothetical protein